MQRAGFGIRFGAWIIDVVILVAVFLVLGLILNPWAATLVVSVVAIAYSLTEVFKAGSPGKQILKLKIVNQAGHDAPIDQLWKRWAVRWGVGLALGLLATITGITLLGWLNNIVGIVLFVGCFMVLGANRQALHDVIAGTVVRQPAPAGFAPQGFQPVMPSTPVPPVPPQA
jgi:uncharacterized RDD family membrane protein YckC